MTIDKKFRHRCVYKITISDSQFTDKLDITKLLTKNEKYHNNPSQNYCH